MENTTNPAATPIPTVALARIVRLRGDTRFPLRAWRQTRRLAVLFAIGLPAIMLAFHFLDPEASPAYIVLPVLAGGLLPLLMPPSGRFEIATGGDAQACAIELDGVLGALGYVREAGEPGVLRYRLRQPGRGRPVQVRIGGDSLAVSGPAAALQSLQRRLAG